MGRGELLVLDLDLLRGRELVRRRREDPLGHKRSGSGYIQRSRSR